MFGTVGIVLFFCVILAILFFVAACRISRLSKRKSPAQQEGLKKMNTKIIASGVVILIIVILALIQIPLFETYGQAVLNWLINFCFFLRCFLQIEVFGLSKQQSSTTTKSSKETNSNTDTKMKNTNTKSTDQSADQ
jgi:uncharacterized protein YacL